MTQPKQTPMMAQYMAIKENYPDAILFYRMGDFYEMFLDDANVASRLLEITLTSRNKNNDDAIPMCGVPVRAADGYIAKLVARGKKVAVCEQVEDPATAKGLVKREVVRVVTPGMILDEALLDEKSNNFILALILLHDRAGLAFLDISTGTFRLTESEDIYAILDEATRIDPSEIILPEDAESDSYYIKLLKKFKEKSVSYIAKKEFDFKRAKETLLSQLNTRSLEGYGCEYQTAGVAAAGALLSYVQDAQLQSISHLVSLETYYLGNYLILDDLSLRNLELIKNIQTGQKKGTLFGVLDQTVTSMGGRLLKSWVRYPLCNRELILKRQHAIKEAFDKPLVRQDIRTCLKSVYDLERLGSKISMGRCNARDLVAFKHSLLALPDIWSFLGELSSDLFVPDFTINELSELAILIDRAIREDAPMTINEGGIIKQGFNSELDELILISRDGKSYIAELGAREKEKSGINSLRVKYNKVFGYFLEVPKSQGSNVPDSYIRKQTLVNTERFITDELKKLEFKVLNAQEQRGKLEYDIFNGIRQTICEKNSLILQCANFIAQIDCLSTLAEISSLFDYCQPEINEDGRIRIEDGRHPVVEKLITGERFVPNSIDMDNENHQVLVITGPNMAGKSTVLRQVAIITILAHMGSFVPAASASISLVDRIFTRVGALDNLSSGQSTFMVEMEETANIMNHATDKSLVIMDEIGRGTSTFDGLSIAWAVAEFLHDLNGKGVKTLFATHYHELTELSETKPRVKNHNIAVKEWNDTIIFLRKLVDGGTNRSYGIQVARLAGIPHSIIARSKKILAKIENDHNRISFKPEIKKKSSSGIKEEDHQPFVQMSLFRKPEEIIIDKLHKLDISMTTPLEALNILSKLKDKLKKIDNANS
ncbi:MAG: DNA mismatch repair protein MutS [Proteobacteria bacterium]|nr:DNA mismatch repair protein MutS [Pseudomonadota bacterium]